MLRKYGIGMVAIIMAVSLVAFTKAPAKKQDTYFFSIASNLTSSETDVENESLWVETSSANACTGSEQKACVVEVPAGYTSGSSPRTLNSSANLDASQYMSTGIYYVSSAAAGITRYNKAQ